jgi:hypothetical protein
VVKTPVKRAPAARKKAADKKAETARLNGKKGGRPKKHQYDEIFADLADPPTGDPMQTCKWAQAICSRALFETVQGRGNRGLNTEIRAFTGTIIRCVPTERVSEAERRIKNAGKARREPTPAVGPTIENVTPGNTGPSSGDTVRG